MSAPLAFFLGAVAATVGWMLFDTFIRERFFTTKPNRRFFVQLGMRYAKAVGLDASNRANYLVMKSLLSNGLANEYYWACWREGIFIPPPPPYELVFQQLDQQNQQTKETYSL